MQTIARARCPVVSVSASVLRALVGDPGLLLVDEPTAALDREKSQEIVKLLADEAHANGVGAVMLTHDHNVLAHCDHVYEMIDGQLHAKSN